MLLKRLPKALVADTVADPEGKKKKKKEVSRQEGIEGRRACGPFRSLLTLNAFPLVVGALLLLWCSLFSPVFSCPLLFFRKRRKMHSGAGEREGKKGRQPQTWAGGGGRRPRRPRKKPRRRV
jgi:hypothetical protein